MVQGLGQWSANLLVMSSNPVWPFYFFFQSDYFRDMQQFMLDWCSEWPLAKVTITQVQNDNGGLNRLVWTFIITLGK